MNTLGIIAGGGDMPRQIAERMRASGARVVVAALEGFADEWVEAFPHARFGLGEIGGVARHFRDHDVDTVTFAGLVRRPDFASLKLDWKGARLLPKALAAATRGDDALLRAVVEAFEDEGFAVRGPETFDAGMRAKSGVLGAVVPGPEHEADIAKAFAVARAMGAMDVGQGAVVCGGLVLAVEAQEGTDRMLARVAELSPDIRGAAGARRGVLVKAAKPVQERRIDLPAVGAETIAGLDRAGLAGVAVEADGAVIVDADAVRAAADAAGVFVVAYAPGDEPAP